MAILTKSKILQGIKEIKKIQLTTIDGEIYLRPLSSAEVNEIINIEAEGYGNFEASNQNNRSQAKGKMNLAKMQQKQNEAQYEAIHKSINNERNQDEWSIEDIQKLPKNTITELYDKIMEISGADVTESDVKQFPEN